MDEKIVFIRGAGRSGSNHLIDQLSAHPELARIVVNQALPEELIDWTRMRLQANDDRVTDEAIAAACRAYFHGYGRAMSQGEGILLHQNTMNAHHLATLLDYWPQGRVVYLVRHPVGWVQALINADIHDYAGLYGYEARVVDTAVRWCSEIRTYLRSKAHGHARLLQVHFEDLVGRHLETSVRILSFLKLEPVELPRFGSARRFAKPFVLSEPEREWIVNVTRDTVAQLGYDPDEWSAREPVGVTVCEDDYAERRLHGRPATVDGLELIQGAVRRATERGCHRIAFFGAGYCMRLLGPELRRCIENPSLGATNQNPPRQVGGQDIVCVIDENPALWGTHPSLWPIRKPKEALGMGIDAVIPTTFVRQQQLAERWKRLANGSVPLFPLWDERRVAVLNSSGGQSAR